MPKPSLNRILIDRQPTNSILGLLRDIIVLQSKLDNFNKQDFYFQKGKESHQHHLNEMKARYAQIVDLVNDNDVDFFLEGIQEAENQFHKICSPGSRSPVHAKLIVDSTTKSQISYFKALLSAKSQFKYLRGLDELMKDEPALAQIFE